MAVVMMGVGASNLRRPVSKKNVFTLSRRRMLQLEAAGQGIAVLSALFVVAGAVLNGVRIAKEEASNVLLSPSVPMTVGTGETMWSIARRYGNPSTSQLDRVDRLARANGLSASATLHPGQRLIVPVENPSEAARLHPVMAVR